MKYVKTFESFDMNHELQHIDESKIDVALNKMDKWLPEDPDAMERYYEIINQESWKEMEEFFIEYGNEDVLQSYGLRMKDMKKLAKAAMESKDFGSGNSLNEAAGDWTLEMELEQNPKAGVVFWEPAMKGNTNTTDLKDARLYLHNFFSMTAAKNYHGLIVKMLNHPSFKDNPNPRDKNGQQFPEQMDGDMNNVKVMMMKDFVKKYPKATKAIAEWPGAMWDESPWSYMYDNYFNSNATKFKR